MEGKIKRNRFKKMMGSEEFSQKIYKYGFVIILLIVWQIASTKVGIPLLLPTPKSTFTEFYANITSAKVMTNIGITMSRVVRGWLIAVLVGVPIGMAMGLSKIFKGILGGVVNSLRQIPMMAWVPLSIIWLGIGDGPTLFMIALNGVFQVIMNTSSGVASIDKDYYNAAKSMGASKMSTFTNVVVPASMPHILVGARLAIGAGWMSVI
ncbi:MAG: ABC transporter permease [Finegoldia magna]|nr:ABC transporter permease [Finegoldia magna]